MQQLKTQYDVKRFFLLPVETNFYPIYGHELGAQGGRGLNRSQGKSAELGNVQR